MVIDFQSTMKNLKGGIYAPVYFLQGAETYYIDTIVNYIEQHALPAQQKMLCFRTYYGKEHTIKSIISHAKCIPMLGTRQVIIVKEAQAMNDLQSNQGQKVLLEYLAKPNPKTTLVFAYKYKNLKSKAFIEAFKKTKNVLFNTPRIYENNILTWINQYVISKGYTISPEAAAILQSLLGSDLKLLTNEIEKMIINLKPNAQISSGLVTYHVGMQREFTPFELQRMIGAQKTEKAFEILYYLTSDQRKNPAILVVSLLTTFFFKLLQLHSLTNKDARKQAEAIQVHPYFMKDYKIALKHHTVDKIKRHLAALHRADLQLKGITPIKDSEVLKELITRILHIPR